MKIETLINASLLRNSPRKHPPCKCNRSKRVIFRSNRGEFEVIGAVKATPVAADVFLHGRRIGVWRYRLGDVLIMRQDGYFYAINVDGTAVAHPHVHPQTGAICFGALQPGPEMWKIMTAFTQVNLNSCFWSPRFDPIA